MPASLPFLDNFNRADGDLAGTNDWLELDPGTATGDFVIEATAARGRRTTAGTAGNRWAYNDGDVGPPLYVEAAVWIPDFPLSAGITRFVECGIAMRSSSDFATNPTVNVASATATRQGLWLRRISNSGAAISSEVAWTSPSAPMAPLGTPPNSRSTAIRLGLLLEENSLSPGDRIYRSYVDGTEVATSAWAGMPSSLTLGLWWSTNIRLNDLSGFPEHGDGYAEYAWANTFAGPPIVGGWRAVSLVRRPTRT